MTNDNETRIYVQGYTDYPQDAAIVGSFKPWSDWSVADLRPMQDEINEDVRSLAAIWDGRPWSVEWQLPAPRTAAAAQARLEVMELMTGMPLIPLHDRLLPSEGQE